MTEFDFKCLKKGDFVKVVKGPPDKRIPKKRFLYGEWTDWVPTMDRFIGQTLTVEGTASEGNYPRVILTGLLGTYYYPLGALEAEKSFESAKKFVELYRKLNGQFV